MQKYSCILGEVYVTKSSKFDWIISYSHCNMIGYYQNYLKFSWPLLFVDVAADFGS